tara:strand:- start:892 stop:1050 length:159 start_codon:yes stop_codon:yes gene_type:complete
MDVNNWEKEYLGMNKKITDREREILNGSPLKSNEGMVYGKMYADWKSRQEVK